MKEIIEKLEKLNKIVKKFNNQFDKAMEFVEWLMENTRYLAGINDLKEDYNIFVSIRGIRFSRDYFDNEIYLGFRGGCLDVYVYDNEDNRYVTLKTAVKDWGFDIVYINPEVLFNNIVNAINKLVDVLEKELKDNKSDKNYDNLKELQKVLQEFVDKAE